MEFDLDEDGVAELRAALAALLDGLVVLHMAPDAGLGVAADGGGG